jgi:Domain of unknown function (DUF4189)
MRGSVRRSAVAVATVCALIAMVGAAAAAGAFAVGACGAYGYGYGFHNAAGARVAALRRCAGGHCRIVGVIRRGCAAMAIDAKNPCGSYGWAINARLGRAENISMRRCYQYGGHACVVRAWACDQRG